MRSKFRRRNNSDRDVTYQHSSDENQSGKVSRNSHAYRNNRSKLRQRGPGPEAPLASTAINNTSESARQTNKSNKTAGKSGRQRRPGRNNSQNTDMPPERLHKVLASLGVASRREIEELIIAGRISVNNQPAHLGQIVSGKDRIKVNGKLVNMRNSKSKTRILLYHKPEGEIVSRNDPEGRKTIFDNLPYVHGGRWVSVGRLDISTSGLLLLTTSGDVANRLMHPSARIEREYAVRVLGEVGEDAKHELLDGILLDGKLAAFSSLVEAGGDGANRWYHVTIHEGRNREVRRMFEAIGCVVNRMIRVRYGDFILPPWLKRGQHRELSTEEVQNLLRNLNEAHREAALQQRFA